MPSVPHRTFTQKDYYYAAILADYGFEGQDEKGNNILDSVGSFGIPDYFTSIASDAIPDNKAETQDAHLKNYVAAMIDVRKAKADYFTKTDKRSKEKNQDANAESKDPVLQDLEDWLKYKTDPNHGFLPEKTKNLDSFIQNYKAKVDKLGDHSRIRNVFLPDGIEVPAGFGNNMPNVENVRFTGFPHPGQAQSVLPADCFTVNPQGTTVMQTVGGTEKKEVRGCRTLKIDPDYQPLYDNFTQDELRNFMSEIPAKDFDEFSEYAARGMKGLGLDENSFKMAVETARNGGEVTPEVAHALYSWDKAHDGTLGFEKTDHERRTVVVDESRGDIISARHFAAFIDDAADSPYKKDSIDINAGKVRNDGLYTLSDVINELKKEGRGENLIFDKNLNITFNCDSKVQILSGKDKSYFVEEKTDLDADPPTMEGRGCSGLMKDANAYTQKLTVTFNTPEVNDFIFKDVNQTKDPEGNVVSKKPITIAVTDKVSRFGIACGKNANIGKIKGNLSGIFEFGDQCFANTRVADDEDFSDINRRFLYLSKKGFNKGPLIIEGFNTMNPERFGDGAFLNSGATGAKKNENGYPNEVDSSIYLDGRTKHVGAFSFAGAGITGFMDKVPNDNLVVKNAAFANTPYLSNVECNAVYKHDPRHKVDHNRVLFRAGYKVEGLNPLNPGLGNREHSGRMRLMKDSAIGVAMMAGSNLKRLHLDEVGSAIGTGAFSFCKNFKEITLSEAFFDVTLLPLLGCGAMLAALFRALKRNPNGPVEVALDELKPNDFAKEATEKGGSLVPGGSDDKSLGEDNMPSVIQGGAVSIFDAIVPSSGSGTLTPEVVETAPVAGREWRRNQHLKHLPEIGFDPNDKIEYYTPEEIESLPVDGKENTRSLLPAPVFTPGLDKLYPAPYLPPEIRKHLEYKLRLDQLDENAMRTMVEREKDILSQIEEIEKKKKELEQEIKTYTEADNGSRSNVEEQGSATVEEEAKKEKTKRNSPVYTNAEAMNGFRDFFMSHAGVDEDGNRDCVEDPNRRGIIMPGDVLVGCEYRSTSTRDSKEAGSVYGFAETTIAENISAEEVLKRYPYFNERGKVSPETKNNNLDYIRDKEAFIAYMPLPYDNKDIKGSADFECRRNNDGTYNVMLVARTKGIKIMKDSKADERASIIRDVALNVANDAVKKGVLDRGPAFTKALKAEKARPEDVRDAFNKEFGLVSRRDGIASKGIIDKKTGVIGGFAIDVIGRDMQVKCSRTIATNLPDQSFHQNYGCFDDEGNLRKDEESRKIYEACVANNLEYVPCPYRGNSGEALLRAEKNNKGKWDVIIEARSPRIHVPVSLSDQKFMVELEDTIYSAQKDAMRKSNVDMNKYNMEDTKKFRDIDDYVRKQEYPVMIQEKINKMIYDNLPGTREEKMSLMNENGCFVLNGKEMKPEFEYSEDGMEDKCTFNKTTYTSPCLGDDPNISAAFGPEARETVNEYLIDSKQQEKIVPEKTVENTENRAENFKIGGRDAR